MREDTAKRRLDRVISSGGRDNEGTTGDAHATKKAQRQYNKAIIHASLEEMAQDEAEARDICVNCGRASVKIVCSKQCAKEAVDIGVLTSKQVDGIL